jgi:hypothetical protein
LPDNLTVGGSLYLRGIGITDTSKVKKDTTFLSWKNGKYILVDGEFTEVITRRKNVWKVKRLNTTKEYYLVTDGNGKYAHGDTIKEAKEDLVYKISNRDKSEFNHLTPETRLTFAEAIESYRVITGACSTGVRNFIESQGIKKKSLKVGEIIKLTANAYGGSEYKNFILTK